MQIDTQLFYTDMTSDLETEAGEMSISANLYVNAKGASPRKRQRSGNSLIVITRKSVPKSTESNGTLVKDNSREQ